MPDGKLENSCSGTLAGLVIIFWLKFRFFEFFVQVIKIFGLKNTFTNVPEYQNDIIVERPIRLVPFYRNWIGYFSTVPGSNGPWMDWNRNL